MKPGNNRPSDVQPENLHPDGNGYGIVPLAGHDDVDDLEGPSARITQRIRFQIALGLLFCILVPSAVRAWWADLPLSHPSLLNSALLCGAALLFGFYASRSMSPFRGATSGSLALPTISASFAVAAIAALLTRINYSTVQIAIHFVLTLVFFIVTERLTSRRRQLRFAVIPGGRVQAVPAVQNVELIPLPTPETRVENIDAVVADLYFHHSGRWDRAMVRSVLAGVPVYHWRHMVEQLTGMVEIDDLSDNSLGTLNPNKLYLKVKSYIDFWVALAALIIFLPVMALVAIAIRLDSPGPALFLQLRTGYRALPITVWKFRTMHIDTAPVTTAREAREKAVTQDNDARITRLGKWLRKTRLDELPQLINVLRGEMSLIGPRPEVVSLTLWYEKELPFYHYRHAIKPGITGWAQVNQGHVAGIDDTRRKLSYDFYYVKNCSIWLDVLIAARTVRTALTFVGAK